MNTINRSAVVVKPAQPFLDWLRRVDETSRHLTEDEFGQEPTIYLLPKWETDDEALKYLADVCDEIFQEQLNSWYRVPSVWPAQRDLKTFLLWFDCSFHSIVIDLSEDRLRHTDM